MPVSLRYGKREPLTGWRVNSTPLGTEPGFIMLRWALLFFVVSIVAGLLGFTGISAATAGIARILFFIAIAVFLVFLVLALLGGQMIF
jgi:uncharacterized membrane protein YtjA (UPF0391 family)